MTGVFDSTTPASTAKPYSKSANPPPFPILIPKRLTATDPDITKSTCDMSSTYTSRPALKAPEMVEAWAGVDLRSVGLSSRNNAHLLSEGQPYKVIFRLLMLFV